MNLSARQQAILDFIVRYRQSHAYGPTRNEIVKAVSLSSTSVCQYNLRALRRLGILTWGDHEARTLEVLRRVALKPACPSCHNRDLFAVLVPSQVGYEWERGVGWTREGDGVDVPSEGAIGGQPYQLTCQCCGETFACLPWT